MIFNYLVPRDLQPSLGKSISSFLSTWQ